jgi:hypothetical protein
VAKNPRYFALCYYIIAFKAYKVLQFFDYANDMSSAAPPWHSGLNPEQKVQKVQNNIPK